MDQDFDLDARHLCPDGGCTGLLDDNGCCKVCRTRGGTYGEVAGQLPPDLSRSEPEVAAEEFEDRQLCPDGNCTGLLGGDGHCKICGAPVADVTS